MYARRQGSRLYGFAAVTKDETGLAIVMGHEIAHAVAQHGNERMTQGLLQQLGAIGLAVALQSKPAQTQEMFMQAYGIGLQERTIAFFAQTRKRSRPIRTHICGMAGYDPNQLFPFWERMAKIGGAAPPELLSTHPSNSTRIADLKSICPKHLNITKKVAIHLLLHPQAAIPAACATNGGRRRTRY